MLVCKMLKTSLPDHQTINMVNRFLSSYMYSWHAHFVKNVLSFWNVNINFSYINISQKKMYCKTGMPYEAGY